MVREIAPRMVMTGRSGGLRVAARGEGLSVLTALPDPGYLTVATLMLSIVFTFSNIGIIIHPKWLPAHSARERSPQGWKRCFCGSSSIWWRSPRRGILGARRGLAT